MTEEQEQELKEQMLQAVIQRMELGSVGERMLRGALSQIDDGEPFKVTESLRVLSALAILVATMAEGMPEYAGHPTNPLRIHVGAAGQLSTLRALHPDAFDMREIAEIQGHVLLALGQESRAEPEGLETPEPAMPSFLSPTAGRD